MSSVRPWPRVWKTNALDRKAIIVNVAKGLEEKTLKRMSQVISEELHAPMKHVATLSGPSHAEEVCRGLPTAAVAAGLDRKIVSRVQTLFENDFFRVYPHDDLIGVELGGTLKNIFAIACAVSPTVWVSETTAARGYSDAGFK